MISSTPVFLEWLMCKCGYGRASEENAQIPVVHIKDIDVIGAETLETGFNAELQGLGVVAHI